MSRYVEDETKAPALADVTTASATKAFIDDYLRPHARRIYRHFGGDSSREGARRIAEWIRSEGHECFTRREIERKQWSGLTKRDDVDAALEALENGHWIFAPQQVSSTTGGRPTTRYQVNPKALR